MPNLRLPFSTFVSISVAASCGLCIAYTSSLSLHFILGMHWLSIFAAVASIGAFTGSLLSGYLLSNYGRRWTMVRSSLIGSCGWVALCFSAAAVYDRYSPSILFLIGRFATGLSAGLSLPAVASYLFELSPNNKLIHFGIFPQLGVAIGVFIAYIFSISLPWEITAAINAFILAILTLGCCLIPESPKWLKKSGSSSEASEVNVLLHGSSDAIGSFEDQEAAARDDDRMIDQSFKYLIQPFAAIPESDRLKLRSIIHLMMLRQLTGISAVLFYTGSFCELAGPSYNLCTILIGLSQIVFTLLVVFLLRFLSKKILLEISSLVMCVGYLLYGLIWFFNGSYIEVIGQVLLVLIILGYSIGWGPLPVMLSVELFPTSTRGYAVGVAFTTNWLVGLFVTGLYYPAIIYVWSISAICFFSSCCFLSFFFVRRHMYDLRSFITQPLP